MVKIHGFEQEERIIHLLVARNFEAMLDADLDEEEVIPVSIATWIVDEIEEDQMIATPVFSKMYNMLADEVEKEHVPNTDWWVREEDPEIIKVVTEALTEKYTLAGGNQNLPA